MQNRIFLHNMDAHLWKNLIGSSRKFVSKTYLWRRKSLLNCGSRPDAESEVRTDSPWRRSALSEWSNNEYGVTQVDTMNIQVGAIYAYIEDGRGLSADPRERIVLRSVHADVVKSVGLTRSKSFSIRTSLIRVDRCSLISNYSCIYIRSQTAWFHLQSALRITSSPPPSPRSHLINDCYDNNVSSLT